MVVTSIRAVCFGNSIITCPAAPRKCDSRRFQALSRRFGGEKAPRSSRAGPSLLNLSVIAAAHGQALLRTTSQALRASSPCRGASGEEARLCGMPRPPLDRGGGIAQAMAERFSPTDAKKPPFGDSSSERGSFLLVLPDDVFISTSVIFIICPSPQKSSGAQKVYRLRGLLCHSPAFSNASPTAFCKASMEMVQRAARSGSEPSAGMDAASASVLPLR